MSREEILAVLNGPMTANQIAKTAHLNPGTVRHLLGAARKRGYVIARADGRRYVYERADP